MPLSQRNPIDVLTNLLNPEEVRSLRIHERCLETVASCPNTTKKSPAKTRLIKNSQFCERCSDRPFLN